ncbi:hypothetical protein M0638_07135 [Roseomonas sp. NAR14]|uniref:Uncharacterized protein n=1 Tax=Roseomonas acroporae TaxID=2937791 RepID=A0A9X1Y553_9PROT|nr:hypothetical protein [Roseomonas acroporae]MCK8784149.1 hypothetical protein [Roseomonas acroporae]
MGSLELYALVGAPLLLLGAGVFVYLQAARMPRPAPDAPAGMSSRAATARDAGAAAKRHFEPAA